MAETGLHVAISVTAPAVVTARFQLAPGQAMALVGPSGAGKTLLLKAIAGLVPAQGEVRLNGTCWQAPGQPSLPAHRRAIGMVFQDGALFPHMSAQANVLAAMPVPDAAAADALLAAMQLAGLENRRPAALSGGQQSRVALARALACQPGLLLLDEPFAAVDPPVRRSLGALVAAARAARPVPLLFVTHDMTEAAGADCIGFLQPGQPLLVGPAAAMLAAADAPLRRWLDGSD
jgi:ABC-type sulfate/molybdate transport systems ATPase subunit